MWTVVYRFGSAETASATGAMGPRGQDGNSWLTGSGAPALALGRERDLYLDTASGRVYQKRSLFFGMPPTWIGIANVKGNTGTRGLPGSTGSRGLGGSPGPMGLTGGKGDTGSTGAAGTDGANGTNGLPVYAPMGPKGQDGTQLLSGTTSPPASSGHLGDYYLNTATGDLYQKLSSSFGVPPTWTLAANLKGPIGTAGTQGVPGPSYSGPGPKGADGATWLNGVGSPSALAGNPGDYYLDNKSGDVFQKRSLFFGVPASWTWLTKIVGPVGQPGKDGATGPPGQSGPPGTPDNLLVHIAGSETITGTKTWNVGAGTSAIILGNDNIIASLQNDNVTIVSLLYLDTNNDVNFNAGAGNIYFRSTNAGATATILNSTAGASGSLNIQNATLSNTIACEGTTGLFSLRNSSNSRRFTVGQTGLTTVILSDAATSSSSDILSLQHASTGTPAAGFGSSVFVQLNSSTTANRSAGRIKYVWSDATDATRKARRQDTVFDTSERVVTQLDTDGTYGQFGFVNGLANGQMMQVLALTELTTIAAAATTDTAITIPAGAVVYGVSVRVTVTIPTAVTFTVTGTTSGTVFNTAAVTVAANSTDPGTAAGCYYNGTAQTIRITPSLNPANTNGRVRVTIHYQTITPPTS